MLFRVSDRRSSLHALTAWMCIALQLAVAVASGWHTHDSNQHIDSAHHADAHSPAHPDHPPGAPHDPQDSDTCVVCTAILALGHATPTLPIRFALIEHQALADPPRPVSVRTVIALGRQLARGPPSASSVSSSLFA